MKPNNVTIRSYQVGFGDSFLVSFHYPKPGGKSEQRHVLIDCGSTAMPKTWGNYSLVDVAQQIKADCDGKLTAVVATHRHADHINGFATNASKTAPGNILRDLKPNLVLQPWTEDPKAQEDAKKATGKKSPGGSSLRLLALEGMHSFSDALVREVKTFGQGLSAKRKETLTFIGEDNVKNLAAVKNLMDMAGKGNNEYLAYGDQTRLETELPGVKIRVLGPPTVEAYDKIKTQRSADKDEFWNLQGLAAHHFAGFAAEGSRSSPFSKKYRVPRDKYPPSVRWLIPRMQASRGAQLMELVTNLDSAMNNTSLILLFEVGGKKLLFPGDAQLENWNYALKDSKEAKANQKLLAQTDFYKVGHHGSLNATPKTLWNAFTKRGSGAKKGSLKTMLSTMAGKHNKVPKENLLTELETHSDLKNTQSLKKSSATANTLEIPL